MRVPSYFPKKNIKIEKKNFLHFFTPFFFVDSIIRYIFAAHKETKYGSEFRARSGYSSIFILKPRYFYFLMAGHATKSPGFEPGVSAFTVTLRVGGLQRTVKTQILILSEFHHISCRPFFIKKAVQNHGGSYCFFYLFNLSIANCLIFIPNLRTFSSALAN